MSASRRLDTPFPPVVFRFLPRKKSGELEVNVYALVDGGDANVLFAYPRPAEFTDYHEMVGDSVMREDTYAGTLLFTRVENVSAEKSPRAKKPSVVTAIQLLGTIAHTILEAYPDMHAYARAPRGATWVQVSLPARAPGPPRTWVHAWSESVLREKINARLYKSNRRGAGTLVRLSKFLTREALLAHVRWQREFEALPDVDSQNEFPTDAHSDDYHAVVYYMDRSTPGLASARGAVAFLDGRLSRASNKDEFAGALAGTREEYDKLIAVYLARIVTGLRQGGNIKNPHEISRYPLMGDVPYASEGGFPETDRGRLFVTISLMGVAPAARGYGYAQEVLVDALRWAHAVGANMEYVIAYSRALSPAFGGKNKNIESGALDELVFAPSEGTPRAFTVSPRVVAILSAVGTKPERLAVGGEVTSSLAASTLLFHLSTFASFGLAFTETTREMRLGDFVHDHPPDTDEPSWTKGDKYPISDEATLPRIVLSHTTIGEILARRQSAGTWVITE